MDPFDDIFAPEATRAGAGGKFQPRVKQRPRKEAPASVRPMVPSETKEKADQLSSPGFSAGELILPVDAQDGRLISCSASFASSGIEESSKRHEDSSSGVPEDTRTSEKHASEGVGSKEDLSSVDVYHQEGEIQITVGVSEDGDKHLGSRKPESEGDFGGLDVDHFVHSSTEPTSSNAGVSSEHRNSESAPSTLPDTEASVQPGDVGKSATQVDSKQFDVDPLDDMLSESMTSKISAGHKFRPKMKPQPRKSATGGVDSALPNLMERPATCPVVQDSLQSVQSIDDGNNTRTDCIESSLAMSEIDGSKEPPKNDEYPCPNFPLSNGTRSLEMGNPSESHSSDALRSEDVVPDGNGDWQSSFGKSLGENADIFSGLEYLDDFVTQTTSATPTEASKSQYKVHMDVQHGDKFLTSYGINNDLGSSVSTSEMETRSVESFSAQAHHSLDSSAFTMCDVAPSQTCSDYNSTQDPLVYSETTVSEKHNEVQINVGGSEPKVAEALFDFEKCEATVASGQRAGKFQPKPKLGKQKEKPSTSNPQAEVRSSLPSPAVDFVPLDNGCEHEGSISELPREGELDYSSARFDDSISPVPTPEIQGDAEAINLTEATHPDGSVLVNMRSEDDPGMVGEVGGKSRTGETSTESNCLRRSKRSSSAMQGTEGGKSSRQLRKRLRQLVDEPVDEANDINGSICDPPSTSNRDEEEDGDEEYRVESTSKKKRARKKANEPMTGNEKPVRKCKSAKEASDGSTKEPPKKFSHSTRRRKRIVDKALLDMPEDEIDPQRLPIKDLILLAEHRERMAIKDVSKVKTPQTNQSADNSFHEDASQNEETFVSEQGQGSDDDPTIRVQPRSSYVNYQSFMDKTPSSRWSKQDTELFYEAVRQIGTDFTIIQQLFPNRTREQVKLKFKKEERQHPLRLSEALTNRATDHSHFESVIGRLQQLAAQAKQESNGNESNYFTGEEEVEQPTPNANDEQTKSELDDEVVKEQEPEVAEVQNSPLKFDEDDDDPNKWNFYDY